MTRTNHPAIFLAILAMSGPASARETALESGVVAELNLLRSNPAAYAEKLRAYRALIGPDGIVHNRGDPVGQFTNEGTDSVDEAIAVLESQAPLPPLAMDPQLAIDAQTYAAEQANTGAIGHVSANGATLSARINRGRTLYAWLAETISYGETTPGDVVRQLVIDDGVPSRGHRAVILAAHLKYVGVGCGTHPRYQFECVEDYSSIPIPPVSSSVSSTHRSSILPGAEVPRAIDPAGKSVRGGAKSRRHGRVKAGH